MVLADGSRLAGEAYRSDQKTDLAIIKVAAHRPLPVVTFGDSDQLRVGEWVVAIGAPRGLDKTVTQGIISAMHRRGIMDPASYEDFLQTDAPINPGNSGGPRLNLYGEVIGVNAVISSASGGLRGSDSRSRVIWPSMFRKRCRPRQGGAWLAGHQYPQCACPFTGCAGTRGAQVMDVVRGGPADKAGLKKNDIIIRYGDKKIASSNELQNSVADTPAGRNVKLTVVRGGQQHELTVQIAELENSTKLLALSVESRSGAVV